jgi:hypothetical protein
MLLFQRRNKTKDRKITDYDCVNCLCSIQQFAAAGVPLPVGGHYVLVEPGANPVLYVTRSGTEDNKSDGSTGNSIGSTFLGFISNFPMIASFIPSYLTSSGEPNTTVATTDEQTSAPGRNPEKVRTPKPKEN